MTLHVELVSPERILWTGEAEWVIARTIEGGEIAFLTGHAPFVGALDIGRVVIREDDGSEQVVAVHGGFVEVSHDRVTILSDVAELKDQIDVARARAAKERAEAQLKGDADDAEIASAARRAEVRLMVAEAAVTSGGH